MFESYCNKNKSSRHSTSSLCVVALRMAESRSRLSMEKREELTRIFLCLDTDGNGRLSREEVGAWLRGAGYSGLTDQQIEVGHADDDLLLFPRARAHTHTHSTHARARAHTHTHTQTHTTRHRKGEKKHFQFSKVGQWWGWGGEGWRGERGRGCKWRGAGG